MSEESQNPALEAFLTADPVVVERPPPAPAPEPQATPAPDPSELSKQKSEAPRATEDDADPADDGSGTVPLAAFRKVREDYKSRAARAEGVAAELRAQLEAARQQPTTPQRQMEAEQRYERLPPPDPARDPAGYHVWQQTERVNDKLDMSEAMLRQQIGDEAVDQMQQEFKREAEADKTLWGKLYAQPHPYAWAHKQMNAARMLRDVGTDPDAYRNKLRAELEAEIRSKMEQPAQAASPVAGLPPSLANIRSSAPRGQTFTGPPDMSDIVGRRSGDIFQKQR